VFENRMLRRIFGRKRNDVAGGWRKIHDEELHSLYSLPNIRMIKARRMKWAGHVARMDEMRKEYKISVLKPGRRDHSEDRCKWKDNIKMDLRDIGFEGVDWIHLA
jgi:hypothetical protein